VNHSNGVLSYNSKMKDLGEEGRLAGPLHFIPPRLVSPHVLVRLEAPPDPEAAVADVLVMIVVGMEGTILYAHSMTNHLIFFPSVSELVTYAWT
jgi:hypothetical protein